MFNVNLKPHIPKKPSRKAYQFHKADKISLRMKAKAVLDKFIKSDSTKNDINTNWSTILFFGVHPVRMTTTSSSTLKTQLEEEQSMCNEV